MGYEPIGRIRPVAPGPSLLTAARPLPDGINWSTGVSWATGCQDSFSWPFCPGPDSFKETPDLREVVHTMPFVIYTPAKCALPIDGGELQLLATDNTETHTAAHIARALWMGDIYDSTDTEQPTLRRAATDVSGAAPYDLDDGIAALLAHYQLATDGQGGAMIHIPGALLTGALGGVSGGSKVCWPEGTIYRGPHGCVVVAGPGYPEGQSADGINGHGPMIDDSPESYAGNTSSTAWIYVTGPVEYAASDVRALPTAERDRMRFRQNTYEVWAERDAIVRFDPCAVFAVEVVNLAPLPEVS